MNRPLEGPWPPLPGLRIGMAACAVAYGLVMRDAIACGDWLTWWLRLALPLLAIQGVAAFVSFVLGVMALARRNWPGALLEAGTTLAVLAAVPVALWANAVATPACQW